MSEFFVTVYYVTVEYDVAKRQYREVKRPAVDGQYGPYASDIEAREVASGLAEKYLYGSAAIVARADGDWYEVEVHEAVPIRST